MQRGVGWPAVAVVAIVMAVFVSSALATPMSTTPRLVLAAVKPLTIKGTGFRATERVRVTVRVGGRSYLRQIRAVRGVITAAFVNVPRLDRCMTELRAVATGAKGSRASLKLAQLQCPPALTSP